MKSKIYQKIFELYVYYCYNDENENTSIKFPYAFFQKKKKKNS